MHVDLWTIGLQTVNFAVLVWLLQRFLYRPVLAAVDARRTQIRRETDAAHALTEQAQAQATAIAAERAGMAAERAAAVQEATAQATAAAAAVRAEAERNARDLLESTRQTLERERAQALVALRASALDLGAALAARVFAEMPPASRVDGWLARIEKHLGELPAPQRQALARQLDGGAVLRAVTAAPLSEAAAQDWRARLQHALGAPAAIEFAVDPALVAGAELQFPTALLRWSWRDTLARVRAGLDDDGRAR